MGRNQVCPQHYLAQGLALSRCSVTVMNEWMIAKVNGRAFIMRAIGSHRSVLGRTGRIFLKLMRMQIPWGLVKMQILSQWFCGGSWESICNKVPSDANALSSRVLPCCSEPQPPVTRGSGALAVWLVWIEMDFQCERPTRVQRLSTKKRM